ncbi:MAG: flagellar basal body P-ring formation chaperone FlgA [Polaromonas sp.]
MKTHSRRALSRQSAMALAMMLAMAAFAPAARSATPAPLSGSARPVIEQFLLAQTAGLPGKVRITIDTPPSGTLPPCDALEAFLPSGARLWGRVSVGVRCAANQPWTRYVQAYVAVVGRYYVAAREIGAGQALTSADAATHEGDLTTLPASIVVDSTQLNGVIALNRIASGAPIRQEFLRAVSVVQQGQNIKLVTQGPGFVVSTEGKAMSNAAIGALVQVKTPNGQLISGVVRADGIVERAN